MLLRFVVILCLLAWSVPLFAADWDRVGNAEVPVDLEADTLTYDKETGLYRASGNVQLKQGDVELRSRILWWNQASGEVEAEGDVEMTSPDEKVTGSKVSYNLNEGTGVVEDGYVFLKEKNIHVHGKQIERLGAMDYRVSEGTFTTCDGDVPSWKFGAKQLDVTLHGYARAKHATFYLKDIPAFYLPYMVYPVKSERESGFLMPRVGYSKKRGYQFNGAYYQVIDVNQDATLYFDYLSEMGLGKGAEYRYIFAGDNAGEARAYHIDVDKIDGEKIDEERYAFDWNHSGNLPGDVRMVADIEYVNDDNFFEDFGEIAEEYNKDKTESVFSLSKNWGNMNLVGQIRYIDDLENDAADPVQYLPRISFDATRQRIKDSSFFYTFNSEYTSFWRREGVRGQRLALQPTLSASFQLWDAIDVTPAVGYRQRYYWGQNDDSSNEQKGIPEFAVKVNTRLQRVYDQPIGPASKLRHTIEPEATYKRTPDVDQDDLPFYESSDRIDELNVIEYALVSRLAARFDHEGGDSTYRELVYLRLSQNYDLRDESSEKRFSDLRGQMTLLPTGWSRLAFDVTYDHDLGRWAKFAAEGRVHDQQENALRFEYRYDRVEEIDYGAINLTVAFLKPIYVSYEKRYDFAARENLEDVVGVEYRQDCWSANLIYRENDVDRSMMLTFTMKGIGEVGGFSGSMGETE